ncbi:NEW3 domain-containing protein [Marilutibacter chinensis]|uniref:NEW3 domain-containing protein n=1 Tax=Marilutibacter chinensis TaxID=2912247 RepID=A0ABS9HPS0_9GAMM|nr:NEW3 domain-containing protein [Lysobacter chinensis]MCF7220944.1 NEW3 domain-containing protein [Lysobacter chinensis]
MIKSNLSKRALCVLLAPLGLAAVGSAHAATTYYVRTDGGNATQCNGRSNTAYPGSGSNQSCAWKHPYYALPSSGTARIAGGDTLMIGPGEYKIGYGAEGMAGGCASGDRSACSLGKVPSGPSASQKTRILGDSKSPPKLWGAERTWSVISLDGSSNVELGHLEITDKDQCVSAHSVASAACNRSSAPYGNWASIGISASNSGNVHIHDVNIHGLALQGINAGGLSNWTLERVKINRNGWAGWDGNVGSASSNSGSIVFRDGEIAWNGCGENPSTGAPVNCWGQKAGGYGDGLGTLQTGGQWLFEDMFVHHNTSDGLDMLYMDGADGSSVTMRRVYAVDNAGNQLKVRGNSTIENSVVVGNCAYFAGKYYMQAGDMCRASGNAISVTLSPNDKVFIRHNTITGEGDGLIMTTDGDASATTTIQNNVLVGANDYLATVAGSPQLAVAHIVYNSSARSVYAGNLVWNVKNNQCPSGSICGQNPKLTNLSLDDFDATPLASSPAVDAVAVLSGVTTDFYEAPRPAGSKSDIGAVEVQAGGTTPSPTPTCSRARPVLSLTGPTDAVAVGLTVNYSLKITNKDSAGCSNTSFSLARSVPSGWTGTLSAGSVALAPGASSTVTLGVTAGNGTVAGAYNIGAGASSAVGSSHTANASAVFNVKEVNTSGGQVTQAVGTDKSAYIGGETVYMSALVKQDGTAVAGTTVRFTATKPNGIEIVMSATTDAQGYARASFVSGTGPSSIGNYGLSAVATVDGKSVTSTTGFSVNDAGAGQSDPVEPAPVEPDPTEPPVVVVPPEGGELAQEIETNKGLYGLGDNVHISGRVLDGSDSVAGARVDIRVYRPNGSIQKLYATTDGDGHFEAVHSIGYNKKEAGDYAVKSTATVNGNTVTATAVFKVIR